ncbi:hypothetical protein WA026_003021 [Henosepilachna vigintioctopunctata]|uniref:Uncharacterized protein n=1 Tax=Henosepilachna vigintioctopunctata TaxID=420089 RepID=A0AAW1TLW2_9CUCU
MSVQSSNSVDDLKKFIEEKILNSTMELRQEISDLKLKVDNLAATNKMLLDILKCNNSTVVEESVRVISDSNGTISQSLDSSSSDEIIISRIPTESSIQQKRLRGNNNTQTSADSDQKSNLIPTKRDKKTSEFTGHIMGTRSVDVTTEFSASPRKIWIYVGRCKSSTTEDDIRRYLNSKISNSVEEFEVEKLNSKGRNCSFKVDADMAVKELLYDPDFWPSGILVKRYFFLRNNHGREL